MPCVCAVYVTRCARKNAGRDARNNVWHPSDGYIGVITKTPEQIFSIWIVSRCAMSRTRITIGAQANDFPLKGLKGPCQKDNDDYWMAFGIGDVTICFPDVSS